MNNLLLADHPLWTDKLLWGDKFSGMNNLFDSEITRYSPISSFGNSVVPAQPSAALDNPVASSSSGTHTKSPMQSPQAEGMQPGETHKRGYAEMKGTLDGTNEDLEAGEVNSQRKRCKATMETPPESTR